MLEENEKFWKLDREYSEEDVASRRKELEAQSSLALTDDDPAGGAAGTSIERPSRPQVWLGDDPGARVHAGPSQAVAPALPSTTLHTVRRWMPREDAQQHRRALSSSP